MDAARAAGGVLRSRWSTRAGGLATKTSATDVALDSDRIAEAEIVRTLRAAYPEDAIVAEEGSGGDGSSGRTWVVDPLDGTVNYLYGIPHYAVSIACEDAAGPLVGVVFDPSREELFVAARSGGAWLGTERLRVSEEADLARALVATGFAYRAEYRALQARLVAELLPRVRDIRRNGSAALDLAWVAAGRFDGYFETGVQAWDVAAGALIVREAGGTADHVAGIGLDRRRGIVATNAALSSSMREALGVQSAPGG